MPLLQLPQRHLPLDEPVVMGVLNVTPDSFSDGGRYQTLSAALALAERHCREGAVIIDVGGESSRPGATPVGLQEEIDRVVPVVEALKARLDCVVSIDTAKPGVMDAACGAGAELVNDIRALREPGGLDVVRRHRVAVCLMHMQGEPRTMQLAPRYGDVVAEVGEFLGQRLQTCLDAGIQAERILLDPGFGFGKTLDHNLRLLAGLTDLARLGRPLLVGLSRKSMFQQLLGLPIDQRLHASVAAATVAAWLGASIIRAHDVGPTVQALRVATAVQQAGERGSA